MRSIAFTFLACALFFAGAVLLHSFYLQVEDEPPLQPLIVQRSTVATLVTVNPACKAEEVEQVGDFRVRLLIRCDTPISMDAVSQ